MRISAADLKADTPLARRVMAALAKEATSDPFAPARHADACDTREHWRSEEELHRAIVALLTGAAKPGVLFFHVPNGGRRGKAEAGRLKGMGTTPGVPDLVVIVAGRTHGLEIKTGKGRLSKSQKAMQAKFVRAGAEFEVARSLADARSILAGWGAIDASPTVIL